MSELEEVLALQIRADGLPEPERQYVFAPPRKWPFDFAWPDRKLAVEVQGGTWTGGRHTRPAGYRNDCEKAIEAARRGWTVLPFTSDMVTEGYAVRTIREMLGVEEG